jgi:maleamate amidohydrolase
VTGKDAGGLQDDYAKAGFDGRLGFGKRPALILVDPVAAYVDAQCPLYAGKGALVALAAMATLKAAAHRAKTPVVLTGVQFQKGGADGGLFFKKVPALRHFEAGSPFGAFAASVAPEAGDVVVMKQYASAFFATSLGSTLTALGVDCCLIGGFSTSGCVRASALDCLQHGFAPFVVREACADRHAQPHEANLFDLQAKYAEVIGLDEALALLAGTAGV